MKFYFFEIHPVKARSVVWRVFESLEQLEREELEKLASSLLMEQIAESDDVYETDFTLRRKDNLPGISRVGKLTTDLSLALDDYLGEQTAALWSNLGYAMIQFNIHGPKLASIEEYLNDRLKDRGSSFEIQLAPVLKPDAYATFLRSEETYKLECTIDTAKLTPEMADSGSSLIAAAKATANTKAGLLNLTLSRGDGKRNGALSVRDEVECLRKNPSVGKLRLRSSVDHTAQTLDFFDNRDYAEEPNNRIQRTHGGKRFDRTAVFTAMRNHFNEWLQLRIEP